MQKAEQVEKPIILPTKRYIFFMLYIWHYWSIPQKHTHVNSSKEMRKTTKLYTLETNCMDLLKLGKSNKTFFIQNKTNEHHQTHKIEKEKLSFFYLVQCQ